MRFIRLTNILRAMVIAAFAFVLNTPTSVQAQGQDIASRIDSLFGWTKSQEPGCACGISNAGKTIFTRGYGLTDITGNVSLNENTQFDIGSSHKQFVAATVLLLAEEKKLSLSDDIHKYVPELPDYGYKITIDHLLSHTSGIRDWTALLPLSGGDTDVFTLILRQKGLNFKPGESWSYSNSGYVLLKEIVSRVSKMPFGDFLGSRVFEPVGMRSSVHSVSMRDTGMHRAIAYEKKGNEFKVSMRTDNNRGGGGILSTVNDLLLWNEALRTGKLGKNVTSKLREPARLNNGRKLHYARGLFVEPYRGSIPMVAHSGGAAGFSTWLGRFPDHDISIAVLCNVEPTSATGIAYSLADIFLPEDRSQVIEGEGPPPAVPDTLNIGSKIGLYISDEGAPLEIALERGFLRIVNGPGLVVLTDKKFRRWGAALAYRSQDAFTIDFTSPTRFELKSMEGKTTNYTPAKNVDYTAAQMKEYLGTYESSEIGTSFIVEPAEDGLQLSLLHTPEKTLRFETAGADMFHWKKRMFIRFQRDRNGRIVALDYTNPVLSKVAFRRTVQN
ncbi:MAG: serine hydrolase [Chitinophagaceae bacterium]|nr:MAG: serine hydrolase [Chitinophagaceae bacterium]